VIYFAFYAKVCIFAANMDKELIKQLEAANDGQSVHLFYDDMAGLYLAFGWSAYYTTMVVNAHVSFSDALQMPVVLLRKGHVNSLRQAMTKLEHTQQSYYHFRIRSRVGNEGYDKWVKIALAKTEL
jgi:hypothetical protein